MANEKRLIDVIPLMQNGWHLVQTGKSNRFLASKSLADVPTVDAVEVVRCRDCKHNGWVQEPCHGKSIDYCRMWEHSLINIDTMFCSYGERKDGDKDYGKAD